VLFYDSYVIMLTNPDSRYKISNLYMSVPVAMRPFTLSHHQMLQIVERSAFLRERMEGRYEPVDGGADNETKRRMEEWKQTVAAGDPERFAPAAELGRVEPTRCCSLCG
jgi:hypothetical protein